MYKKKTVILLSYLCHGPQTLIHVHLRFCPGSPHIQYWKLWVKHFIWKYYISKVMFIPKKCCYCYLQYKLGTASLQTTSGPDTSVPFHICENLRKYTLLIVSWWNAAAHILCALLQVFMTLCRPRAPVIYCVQSTKLAKSAAGQLAGNFKDSGTREKVTGQLHYRAYQICNISVFLLVTVLILDPLLISGFFHGPIGP